MIATAIINNQNNESALSVGLIKLVQHLLTREDLKAQNEITSEIRGALRALNYTLKNESAIKEFVKD